MALRLSQLEKLTNQEATRCEFGPGTGVFFYLRPWGNREFEHELSRRLRAIKAPLESLSVEAQEEVMARVASKTIVEKWEGLLEEDGSELAFSMDECSRLLRENYRLHRWVQDNARALDKIAGDAEEEDAKNSPRSSDGHSSGGRNTDS